MILFRAVGPLLLGWGMGAGVFGVIASLVRGEVRNPTAVISGLVACVLFVAGFISNRREKKRGSDRDASEGSDGDASQGTGSGASASSRQSGRPAESSALPVEVASEPFVGNRHWQVRNFFPEGWRLVSGYSGDVLEPFQRVVARCHDSYGARMLSLYPRSSRPVCKSSPAQDCSCGIYALKGSVELPNVFKPDDPAFVVGEVYLWGRVIEATNGYRAEFAYPKRLYVVNGSEKLATQLSLTYGVPCEVWGV